MKITRLNLTTIQMFKIILVEGLVASLGLMLIYRKKTAKICEIFSSFFQTALIQTLLTLDIFLDVLLFYLDSTVDCCKVPTLLLVVLGNANCSYKFSCVILPT